MARNALKLGLLLLVFSLNSQTVFACSAGNPDGYDAYSDSEVVFTGRVINIDKDYFYLEVITPYKGLKNETTIAIYSPVMAPLGRNGCDYFFEDGEEYLVYANRGTEGKLSVSAYSGTVELSDPSAQQEIKEFSSWYYKFSVLNNFFLFDFGYWGFPMGLGILFVIFIYLVVNAIKKFMRRKIT